MTALKQYILLLSIPQDMALKKATGSDLGALLEQGPQEGNDLQSLAQAHLICQHCPIPAHPQCTLIKPAHAITDGAQTIYRPVDFCQYTAP